MAMPTTDELETQFAQLPPHAQLSLLERLVHRVRVSFSRRSEKWDSELHAMASDPEVQKELSRIRDEFHITEADGLGHH